MNGFSFVFGANVSGYPGSDRGSIRLDEEEQAACVLVAADLVEGEVSVQYWARKINRDRIRP